MKPISSITTPPPPLLKDQAREGEPALTLGLALSGGGSRATAFHLGCLRALHDLGVLNQVKILSTVSGGSVIGALPSGLPHLQLPQGISLSTLGGLLVPAMVVTLVSFLVSLPRV